VVGVITVEVTAEEDTMGVAIMAADITVMATAAGAGAGAGAGAAGGGRDITHGGRDFMVDGVTLIIPTIAIQPIRKHLR
jgi:hypothetical protein